MCKLQQEESLGLEKVTRGELKLNKQQAQVKEFHEAFKLGAPETPCWSVKDVAFRMKLVVEEMAEGYEALHALGHNDDPIPIIDLLCDLKYFIDGTAVAMGVDLEPFFDAIHVANMNKLKHCEECDGQGEIATMQATPDMDETLSQCSKCKGLGRYPMYREDGKVKKPDTWVEQDLYKVWEEVYGTR